jgi:tripartite-type tricarboxylate transporter receptor subunit TctC
MAPAGTPEQARNALHLAALEVLSRPEMIADLSKQGLVPTITTEKDFADFIQADMAKWARVVKAADHKLD